MTKRSGFGASTVSLIASRGAAAAMQAAVIVLLARSVPVDVFGIVNAFIGALLFIGVVFDFGGSTLLARARAADQQKLQEQLVTLNRLTTLAFLLTGITLIGVAVAGTPTLWVALPLATAAAFEKYAETLSAVLIADGRIGLVSANLVARRAISLALFVIMVTLPEVDPVFAYASATTVGSMLGAFHIYWRVQLRGSSVRAAMSAIGPSVPFFVSNATAQVRTLDVSLVALASGATSSGLYAAATKITNPIYILPSALTSLLLPRVTMSRLEETRRMLTQVLFGYAAFAALTVPAGILAAPAAAWLFGEAYAGMGSVLFLCIIAVPVVGLSSSLGAILQARGHHKYVAVNGLFFAVLLVVGIAGGAALQGAAGAAACVVAVYLAKDAVLTVKTVRVSGTNA